MTFGFETALSALGAARTALGVIGHNLTNSATPGYSRQRITTTSARPDLIRPGLAVGRGVVVTGVQRVVDDFVTTRLREQRGELSRAEVRRDLYGALDASYGEPGDRGVNAAFGKFFDEIRGFAFQPGDAAAQSGLLQRGTDLSVSLRDVRGNLLAVRRDAGDRVSDEIGAVNDLVAQLDALNRDIAHSGYGSNLPGDVLDRIEGLLGELGEHVDVQATVSGTGRILVVSGGVSLVEPGGARKLEFRRGASPAEPSIVRVAGTEQAFRPKSGGLRGALDLDADLVKDRLGVVDAVASTLIRRINHAHATGVPPAGGYRRLTAERAFRDADGDGDVTTDTLKSQGFPFDVATGTLTVNVLNEADGSTRQTRIQLDSESTTVGGLLGALNGVPSLNAVIDGAGRLRVVSDAGYRFDFSNRVGSNPDTSGSFGVPVVAGGSYTGTLDANYVLTPSGAGEIGVTPGLTIGVSLPDGTVIGTLDVGSGYAPGDELPLGEGLTVSFGAGQIDPTTSGSITIGGVVDGDTSGVLTALGLNGFFSGSDAATIEVSQHLLDDPSLTASGAGGGAADARNLDRLLAVETQPDEALDGLDIPKRYAVLVGDSGYEAARAAESVDLQSLLLESLEERRAQTSGVNVDEELIRMEEWQQAFEVAARFAKTLTEISDLLVRLAE